jgi:hypothetical protein
MIGLFFLLICQNVVVSAAAATTSSEQSAAGIPCRISEEKALEYLKSPDFMIRERNGTSAGGDDLDFRFTQNTTAYLELPLCDFDNLTVNWDPYVLIQNMAVIREILTLMGEHNYDFLFQMISTTDSTFICEKPPSYTIDFMCRVIPTIPSFAPVLQNNIYYPPSTPELLDALEQHTLTNMDEDEHHETRARRSPVEYHYRSNQCDME